ncbi:MAG: DUF1631 domain-containing protein [Gammaproteobacteria bacterium]|nr:DUF1631 domain-containing protein [Gammaproteobacteria bacterium]
MAFQNNIISFGNAVPGVSEFSVPVHYQDTVKACRELMSQRLPGLMGSMFENLDDALYKLADKADTNQAQTGYFDAMREVRKQRKKIENGFAGRLVEGYDRFWKTGSFRAAETSKGGGGLSLMDKTDLEENLAFTTMASRGENRYYRDLYALEQRISQIFGGESLSSKTNPLAPAAICSAFNGATSEMVLDLQVKLVIYKQFERKVVDALGGFYNELNELLANAGILKTLTAKAHRGSGYNGNAGSGPGGRSISTTEASPREETGEAASGLVSEAHGGAQGNSNLQNEFFSTLQQLLGRHRPVSAPAAPLESGNSPVVVPAADVLAALSVLQQSSQAMAHPVNGGVEPGLDVRTTLLKSLQAGGEAQAARHMDRTEEDAIDVITMLFEIILEDQNLPDGMKALLARMQIPMLKVAILDKAFFSQKSHPARRLLNSMARAAVGWSEANGRADGGLYAHMESIVQRILGEFDNDVSLFTELHERLKAFLEREERSSKVTEQRTAQVTQGKEQLKVARHQVFEEINNRLFGLENVPDVVAKLLREGWKDVLLLICLRKGQESPDWQKALDTMDRLLWSVEPKPLQNERQRLVNEMPMLLKALRSGLNDISYDPHKMASQFKDLQACHLACLKGAATPARSVEPLALWKDRQAGSLIREPVGTEPEMSSAPKEQAAPPAGGEGAEKVRETNQSHESDDYSQVAETLKVGTWLEVARDPDDVIRAKLSWRSRMSGTSLFVNRKGMKVAEIDLFELAAWFREGKARVIDAAGAPLVDRAMSTMVKSLENKTTPSPA